MTSSQGSQIAKLVDPANITGIPSYDLFKPVVRIGRSMTNDYIVKQKTVSGKHATIERRENGYVLIDLNSTNKTKVNGKELKPNVPYLLEDDDESISTGIGSSSATTKGRRAGRAGCRRLGDHRHRHQIQMGTGDRPEHTGPTGESAHSGTIDIGSRPPSGQTDRTNPSEPEAASKIGTYEVDTLLGRGGFGSVWKCKDSGGNPVAVKLLNPDALENERAVRKFFHEAIILSKMSHPNICRFIDFFPHDENYAIVMDFVTGTDLKEMLKEQEATIPFQMAAESRRRPWTPFITPTSSRSCTGTSSRRTSSWT